MKLINQTKKGIEISNDVYEIYKRDLKDILEQEYNSKFNNHNLIRITTIYELFKDKFNISILDLGCGSVNSLDNNSFHDLRLYEPWFLRSMHELGADCTGIDLSDNSEEKFKAYKIDLSLENSLNCFEDNSYDAVTAFSFFDSPYLYENKNTQKNVFNLLLPQLERIIKPEGYFIFDSICTPYYNS